MPLDQSAKPLGILTVDPRPTDRAALAISARFDGSEIGDVSPSLELLTHELRITNRITAPTDARDRGHVSEHVVTKAVAPLVAFRAIFGRFALV